MAISQKAALSFAGAAAMSPDRLAKFKTTIEALIAEVQRKEAPAGPVDFAGEVVAPMLEHNVRKTFLNRLLTALEWQLETAVAEEARVKGDTTLFLDYLGVHLVTRIPVLIFEAKAWEKPPVSPSAAAGRRIRPEELIARALNYVKGGKNGDSPVTAEWIEWLEKLQAYVSDLKEQSGHLVSRVAISSGQWLVIFTEPGPAFLDPADVKPGNILVFQIDNFVRESDDIFRQISYGQLVDHVPSPLRTTQLHAFISAAAVRRLFRALWIRWESSGAEGVLDTFPQIFVYPAIVLERADGVLIHVAEARFGRSPVPAVAIGLSAHLEEVEQNSVRLLHAIFGELQQVLEISDLDAFPGFPETPLRGSSVGLVAPPASTRVQFIWRWPQRSSEYLLVTGASPHFLLERPRVTACVGHDWVRSSGIGLQVGHAPILAPSVNPKSFYISGDDHHCAHRIIHDRRSGRCHLASFEMFLCCKACVFQETCWPATSTTPLPCGATMEPSVVNLEITPAVAS
jgi:hypothetical protein